MGVIPHTSVESFFQEVVVDALGVVGVAASPEAEYYLVGLLGEFTRARITDEPLGLVLADVEQDGGKRLRALKKVGDTSLYVSGFFAESLDRQLVKVDYYMDLGGAAYRELAGRLDSSSVSDVYRELSDKFPRFVDVLTNVRSQVSFIGDDVVKLYQEWTRTKAEWIEQRLRKMGMIVSTDDDDSGGGYLQ